MQRLGLGKVSLREAGRSPVMKSVIRFVFHMVRSQ